MAKSEACAHDVVTIVPPFTNRDILQFKNFCSTKLNNFCVKYMILNNLLFYSKEVLKQDFSSKNEIVYKT